MCSEPRSGVPSPPPRNRDEQAAVRSTQRPSRNPIARPHHLPDASTATLTGGWRLRWSGLTGVKVRNWPSWTHRKETVMVSINAFGIQADERTLPQTTLKAMDRDPTQVPAKTEGRIWHGRVGYQRKGAFAV